MMSERKQKPVGSFGGGRRSISLQRAIALQLYKAYTCFSHAQVNAYKRDPAWMAMADEVIRQMEWVKHSIEEEQNYDFEPITIAPEDWKP